MSNLNRFDRPATVTFSAEKLTGIVNAVDLDTAKEKLAEYEKSPWVVENNQQDRNLAEMFQKVIDVHYLTNALKMSQDDAIIMVADD